MRGARANDWTMNWWVAGEHSDGRSHSLTPDDGERRRRPDLQLMLSWAVNAGAAVGSVDAVRWAVSGCCPVWRWSDGDERLPLGDDDDDDSGEDDAAGGGTDADAVDYYQASKVCLSQVVAVAAAAAEGVA